MKDRIVEKEDIVGLAVVALCVVAGLGMHQWSGKMIAQRHVGILQAALAKARATAAGVTE